MDCWLKRQFPVSSRLEASKGLNSPNKIWRQESQASVLLTVPLVTLAGRWPWCLVLDCMLYVSWGSGWALGSQASQRLQSTEGMLGQILPFTPRKPS